MKKSRHDRPYSSADVRQCDRCQLLSYPRSKNCEPRHRAIGLGLMGFQDALYILNISYASHEAVQIC